MELYQLNESTAEESIYCYLLFLHSAELSRTHITTAEFETAPAISDWVEFLLPWRKRGWKLDKDPIRLVCDREYTALLVYYPKDDFISRFTPKSITYTRDFCFKNWLKYQEKRDCEIYKLVDLSP